MSNYISPLAAYLRDINPYSETLSAEEELELGRRIKDEHDEEAREELINHNLRLVIYIAKPFKTRGNHNLSLEDLISEGNRGLIKAVDKYDYTLGYRFSTCAVPWIKQAIMQAIAEQSRSIRVPAHIIQQFNSYKRAYEKLSQDKEPTNAEIAAEMGITENKLDLILQWKRNTISLESPLDDSTDGDTLSDIVADPDERVPSDYAEESCKQDFVNKLLSGLNDRVSAIIKLRFGVGNANDPEEYRVPHTLEEIGKMLKPAITRERVRQIIEQQLARWRTQYGESPF